ncbi:hypothetical protein ONZ51_g3463 [Trametes cubensis]|uniref:Hyaluronan/mRNA-binding protein domain-containing protein n=1 Tax=Trametes cubensis TaxID=1111947 RepID=A0AAD7TXT0_9APHY|nr:hypothetical protein ONZ51_g3463 [Trametes cubensis]
MTRTARASYPSAINKDRSEAKNGMDKHIPKGGAGPHNWGPSRGRVRARERRARGRAGRVRGDHSSLTPEEVQQGIEFRKKALKSPDVDLASIARTAPAISASPTQSTPVVSDADTKVKTA